MLFFVLIISLILVYLSVLKYRKITNPFVLEVYSIFLMIMVPQLLWLLVDPAAELYIFSDLAILVYIVGAYLGTSFSIKAVKLKRLKPVPLINAVNWGLFTLFLLPLIPLFMSFEFSMEGIRYFYEYVVFSKYASFFELSKFALYLIIFYRIIYKDRVSKGTLLLIPLLFLYGSKMALLDFFIAFFIFLEYFKTVSYRKVVVAAVAGAMILIFYRYYQTSDYDNLWLSALGYFDQYKNQTFLIRQLMEGKADYYYGEIYGSSYLKYIPRIIWPDKPPNFGFAIINYDFMPENARLGYMPAFGLGSLFADFGFFSLAFTSFFLGVLRRFLYNTFIRSKNNISFFLYAFPLTFVSIIFISINVLTSHFVDRSKKYIYEPPVSN